MIRVTLISAAALVGAMGAYAGEKSTFADLDTNADGYISASEFIAHKTADGKYTQEEATDKFTAIAGDDGQISEEDWNAAMEAAADKADTTTGETTW